MRSGHGWPREGLTPAEVGTAVWLLSASKGHKKATGNRLGLALSRVLSLSQALALSSVLNPQGASSVLGAEAEPGVGPPWRSPPSLLHCPSLSTLMACLGTEARD